MSKSTCEEEVYKSIFVNKAEKVRNFIYYKSGNMALAEDLVQEAFIKLWSNCKSVPFEKAGSYLYSVAGNLFLNHYSHNKVVLKFNKSQDQNINIESPHYLMEEKEFKVKLEKIISELPSEQREVFLMSRIDDKKYREIAEDLDVSVKTVEKRMHLALTALRKVHERV